MGPSSPPWTCGANDVADKLAKLGVEYHRVPAEEVRRWKAEYKVAMARAKWVGMATHAAGNVPDFPFRDSEAARWKAVAAQRSRAEKKMGIDGRRRRRPRQVKQVVPEDKGGHCIRAALSGHGWLCTVCKRRTGDWRKLALSRCGGTKAGRVVAAGAIAEKAHIMVTAGTLRWCVTCGCFAESRTTQRMQLTCPGPPPLSAGNGGMKQQLMQLRAGLHPVTGARLPAALDAEGRPFGGSGLYSRLKPNGVHDPNFSPYVPATLAGPVPQEGRSAVEKKTLMLERIRSKRAKEDRNAKRLRKLEAKTNLAHLIATFGNEQLEASSGTGTQVDSDEEFWNNLPVGEVRHERLRCIPEPPAQAYRGRAVQLRREQLVVRRDVMSVGSCKVLTCFNRGCRGDHP